MTKKQIDSFVIYKNNTPQDIKFITTKDKMSQLPSSYTVGISVQDFARIFNLKYTIDEKEGTL